MRRTHGHTDRDYNALVAAGIDPATTQPREHNTLCWCAATTRHQSATCDRHYVLPGAATRALQAVTA